MKKIFLKLLALIIFSQLTIVSLQAATTSATLFLEANVITSDLIPPSKPLALHPQHQNHLCNPLVVFSWREATDEGGIAHYHFQLKGKLKKADGTFPATDDFNFSKQITGSSETADYRVWQQADIFYLQLKNPLAEGKYTWAISAQDNSGNDSPLTPDDWLAFDYLPSIHCPQPVICGPHTMAGVSISFGGAIISSHNPNLTITYPLGQQPQTLVSLSVDDQVVAQNIALINQQNPDFSVNHQEDKRQIVIQFTRPYLKEKNNQEPYQIKLELKDNNDCSKKFSPSLQVSIPAPPNTCQTNGTIPQLISPPNNMIVTEPDDLNLLFIWDICAPLKDITHTTFIYNNQPIISLTPHTVSTSIYNFNISPLGIGSCGKELTRFELKFKKRQFTLNGQAVNLSYNDPLNQSDYHHWSVSVLDCSGTTTNSTIARLRRLPGNLGTYFFCTNTAECQQGTLADCLKSGKNCYFHDQAGCLANAPLDCGGNPPVKTYFWCDSEQTCTKGLLSTCSQMGKNCYLWEADPNGNDFGCLNRAHFECSREKARYQWCATDNTCRLGTLYECIASGQFCYRQEMGQTICPQTGRLNCFSGLGLVVQQQFPGPDTIPAQTIDWLEWLIINVIPLLPYFLLPLAILFIFFPSKVGLVFNPQTNRPIKHAQVLVTRAGIYAGASSTNFLGMYFGFRLKEGEHQLFVSHPNYLFPANKNQAAGTNKWYYGDPFTLKHQGKKVITHLIPLDADPSNPPPSLKPSKSALILTKLAALINSIQFFWGFAFALAIIAALISPTLINLLVLLLFTISLLNRLLLSRLKVNLSGNIINADRQTTQMTPLRITLEGSNKLVLSAFTSNDGAFINYLNKKLNYRLSAPGFYFVIDNGNQTSLPLKFTKNNLSLTLVVINQQAINV